MVEADSHAVGVVATNDEVLTFCLNLKTVDGVILKPLEDDIFGVLWHDTVHQSTHGDDFRVGFGLL